MDILNANLRYLQQVTGTNFDTPTERKVFFTSPAFVTTVGIFWTDVAVPIVYLASDAAKHITGIEFNIDGGESAR